MQRVSSIMDTIDQLGNELDAIWAAGEVDKDGSERIEEIGMEVNNLYFALDALPRLPETPAQRIGVWSRRVPAPRF
jgi:hypothetical protein